MLPSHFMQQTHSPSGRIRPLLRSEYDQLVDLGAFTDERIQLLEGALVEMSPSKAPHANMIVRLTRLFMTRVGERCEVRVQLPFAATADSEPEPDIALVERGEFDEHPSTAYLVVEVSWDSRRIDLGTKARIYAAAGVPEYWVLDLKRSEVVVHRRPVPGAERFDQVRVLKPGASIAPLKFPRLKIPVETLAPPQREKH
jgi:Uma2 family endonuclease